MTDEKSEIEAMVANHGLFPVLNRMVSRLNAVSDILAREVQQAKDYELIPLIVLFHKLGVVWDNFNETKKKYNELYDQLSMVVVPEKMRESGVKTINVENVGRVTVSYRYACSMVDKDAAMQWLEYTGNGSLIQRTVNSSSLAAFAKNMVVTEGKELPPAFKVSINPFTSITKV
jgi:hypothetical protein